MVNLNEDQLRELIQSMVMDNYTDEEIRQVVDISKPVFQHILPNIEGVTIALEPGYCGGIVNSCQIMDQFHSQLFAENNEWKNITPAPEGVTAQTVFDDYLQAIGGEQKLSQIEDMTQKMTGSVLGYSVSMARCKK